MIDLAYGWIDPRVAETFERGGGAAGAAADARALARRAGGGGGGGGAGGIGGLGIFAPLIVPYDWNATSVCRRLAAPSAAHWFGCDLFGRDILSRVLVGARYSLQWASRRSRSG